MTDDTLPFAGLKVIDCASYVAAPAAATVLADFGAEVIKLEPVGEGEPWRNQYRRPGLPPTPINYPWLMDNRNKLGLALDLKASSGRAVLERLLGRADVFITNLPLPARARLGLRYVDVGPRHPRLIYASLTAYGERGEEAGKTGFDATAYWARSGLMDVVRPDGRALPARSVPGMGDHPTSMALYGAIVTALYRRQATARGGEVSASLLAGGLWANSYLLQAELAGAPHPPRPPRSESITALGNTYRTADGRWLMLAIANDRQWPALAAAVGRPELVQDPRFAGPEAMRQNAVALMQILDEAFVRRSLADWRPVLDAAGLTYGVVASVAEAARDPQALAAGFLRPLADTGMMTVDSPFSLGGVGKAPVARAPEHGEHSRRILREAGYSEAEIDALRVAGTIAGP